MTVPIRYRLGVPFISLGLRMIRRWPRQTDWITNPIDRRAVPLPVAHQPLLGRIGYALNAFGLSICGMR